ncbi:MAG: endonuclease/exonuclease/phosphatase family protein, partial [Sulfurospirillaceae bacterium]|nr:endonuclease/exonuclease/phosphatase family protein [Sulfurospirillaceae bacterium]
MRFLWLLCTPFLVWALDFKVATYNVENLFDLAHDGHEYEEYIPHNKHQWNEQNFQKKLDNIAKVIKDLDADILTLEEIENENVLKKLNLALGDKAYPYIFYPSKKERSSIESALLSRFPITSKESLMIKDQARGIHRISVKIEQKTLVLYLNHWPAGQEKVEERMAYAAALNGLIKKHSGDEYIILGDLNAPYKIEKDDWGMALVNVLKAGDKGMSHYNLWYELAERERYSHVFGKKKGTLDHILIPQVLSNHKGIDYKPSSFSVFQKPYMLDEKGNPLRWQITDKGRGEHLGLG